MDTKNYNWISTCPTWDDIITGFLKSETGNTLKLKIKELRETHTIYPESKNLFRAFTLCPYAKVKVVILGQDPYPDGSADGLAFSSSIKTKRPSSLKNIFAEIMRTEYADGVDSSVIFLSNSLESWAQQGVLLLNRTLTVEAKKINSHKSLGWSELIGDVLTELNKIDRPIVFMLWGAHAQDLGTKYLNNKKHLILESYHPQAQNYPGGDTKMFVGNNHFQLCNQFFVKQTPQILGINWRTT